MKIILLKIAQWKYIVPIFFLSAIFNFYLFPKHEVFYNDESLESLDIRRSYTKAEVLDLFEKLGEEGRSTYQYVAGVIDMIYPIVYGALLILLLSLLIRSLFRKKTGLIYLSLLPILIMVFDYAENTNTLMMLKSYPDISNSSFVFGSTVSGIKWYLVSVVLIILISGFLFWLIKQIVLAIAKRP